VLTIGDDLFAGCGRRTDRLRLWQRRNLNGRRHFQWRQTWLHSRARNRNRRFMRTAVASAALLDNLNLRPPVAYGERFDISFLDQFHQFPDSFSLIGLLHGLPNLLQLSIISSKITID
jgi:hypothetical protein